MHLRCPHCHSPFELLPEQPLHEVCCPSCGSSFNLISGDPTGSNKPEGSRRLAHFELLEQLGVGHFGSVWKARDTELDRLVAIKIPRRENLEPQETELFLREARAAAQLRHLNIVSVHEVGRADDTVYIASDYIEGCNLKEWLTGQKLTFRESAELCVTIANALHHAHESGIVHRDLKPGNILMGVGQAFQPDPDTQRGLAAQPASKNVRLESLTYTPYLTDFGLAKRESGEITMTVEGQILGTPAYMSPEQAKGHGHQADRRSDIYSLGVILFELLTGELPFRGETRMLIVQILKDEPPSPRKLNARIPRDLETITLKCLSKDPTHRYPTVAEVAADLQRHLRGEPILARPVSQAERLVRWCQRNQTLATMTTAIAALLFVGTFVSTYFAFRARTNAKRADDKASDASRNLYVAHMNLAQTALENGHVDQTIRLLDLYRSAAVHEHDSSDLRGFEWFYWDRLCHSNLLTLKGHTGPVLRVAYSMDGKRLASASGDGTVKLWDTMSGQETLTLKGHTGPIYCVAFSADGKRLASSSEDGTMKVWDATSGQEILTLKDHRFWVFSMAFSADGKRLTSVSDNKTVKVWDTSSGRETAMLTLKGGIENIHGIGRLSFSADGKWLASGSDDGMITVWDSTSGEERFTWKGHTGYVFSVAFSADGKRLASASGDLVRLNDPGELRVWDATSGQEMLTLKGHRGAVTSVAFSTDGKRLASASGDRQVKVWDAMIGHETLTLNEHTNCVAFSPDGKRLVSASGDLTVKVWDATIGQDTLTLKGGHSDTVTEVAFSVDGNRLASASMDNTVKLWNVSSGQETLILKGHSGPVYFVAFCPDGKRLVSASYDQTVKVWDATSGQETLSLKGHTSAVLSVAYSVDGKRLASASDDGTLKVWDATTGHESLTFALKGHTGKPSSWAFSRDGRRLASVSDDGTIKVWDVTSGQETLTLVGQTRGVFSVALSTDGKLLASAGRDPTVKVWDTMSGQEVVKLKGHTGPVFCVAFSADGKRLVSASHDQTAKLWDIRSGQETLTLKGHTDAVLSVVFSPDGKRLASVGGRHDQTVKVWDAWPWTLDLRAEREALSVIRWLQDRGKPSSEWLDAIAADKTISEPVRQRALQFAREWKP